MKSIKTEIGDYTGKHYKSNFDCYNYNLDSLEGAPKSVGGNFYCSDNNLDSLEGAPQYVGGSFYCNSNNFITLKGAPNYVGGNFICYNSNLKSLEGLPQYIGGHFKFNKALKQGENLYIIANAVLNGSLFDEINVLKQLFT